MMKNELEKMHCNYKIFIWLTSLMLLMASRAGAQETPRVLFVGNSYTYVNNLPQMVADIAQSMGDNMEFGSNTPGGCSLALHCQNQSMVMICQGGWDYVILQEQSQLPAFPIDSVEMYVFPYAKQLVDSVVAFNPEAEPMFYMTWGRRNGDTEFGYPPMDTYEGMDSLLYERYMQMGVDNDASVCPVGRVWHYLRDHNAEIELYMSDGSHPSLAGSYAAACAFYTMLFGRDPDSIPYDAGLDAMQAHSIRAAAKAVVYDSLWKWKRPLPNSMVAEVEKPFVSVSPNPSNGMFTLHLPHGQQAEASLLDLNGKELWRKQVIGPAETLSLQSLPNGLYILRVVTEETTDVIRIVKE